LGVVGGLVGTSVGGFVGSFVGAFVGKGVGSPVGGHKLGSHTVSTVPVSQLPRSPGFPLLGKHSSCTVHCSPLVG
jgi:outer membrane lipoprotein SlyB